MTDTLSRGYTLESIYPEWGGSPLSTHRSEEAQEVGEQQQDGGDDDAGPEGADQHLGE